MNPLHDALIAYASAVAGHWSYYSQDASNLMTARKERIWITEPPKSRCAGKPCDRTPKTLTLDCTTAQFSLNDVIAFHGGPEIYRFRVTKDSNGEHVPIERQDWPEMSSLDLLRMNDFVSMKLFESLKGMAPISNRMAKEFESDLT